MKFRLQHLSRTAFSALLISASMLAPISAFAWDEQGEALEGEKYGFGDSYVTKEKCFPVKENGLWGFVNEKGKVTIKPKYQEIGKPQPYQSTSTFEHKILNRKLIPVKLNGKWGFVDQNGKEIVKPQFDQVGTFQSTKTTDALGYPKFINTCTALKDSQMILIDKSGKTKEVLGFNIQKVIDYGDALLALKDGKITILQDNGDNYKVSLTEKPDFYKAEFKNNFSLLDRNGEFLTFKKTFKDNNNNTIAYLIQGDVMRLYDNNLMRISDADYVDFNATPKFASLKRADGVNDIFSLADRKIILSSDKNIIDINGDFMFYSPDAKGTPIGVIKRDGSKVLDPVYEKASFVGDGKNILTMRDGKYGVVTIDGKTVLDPIYEEVKFFDDEKNIRTKRDGKYGVVTIDGKTVLDPIYEEIGVFDDGKNILTKRDGKFGIASIDGETVLPNNYTDFTRKGNNLVLTSSAGVSVFNLPERKTLLPEGKYSSIGKYINKPGAYWVSKDNKWGVVSGDFTREIIPPIYADNELKTGFTNSLDNNNCTFHVYKNGTVGVIDVNGKTIIPVGKYTGIRGYDMGGICVEKGNKVGLVDKATGKQIISPIHNKIEGVGKGHYLASDNTSNGFIAYVYDKTGRLLKKQAFSASQQYAITYFIKDWMGTAFLTYNFTY